MILLAALDIFAMVNLAGIVVLAVLSTSEGATYCELSLRKEAYDSVTRLCEFLRPLGIAFR
jgi:hypothetical protein